MDSVDLLTGESCRIVDNRWTERVGGGDSSTLRVWLGIDEGGSRNR